MPVKLGELLIREGIITPAQLEEALKNHVIYGIKLGSSLVEMGCVDEERLADLLSVKFKMPRVSGTDVLSAPNEVIGLVSRELAAKHRIIPFRLERRRLSIAMSDPSNFKAIEEVGFTTSMVVISYIAPDVVISKALARFYQTSEGEARYSSMARNIKKEAPAPPPPARVTFEVPSESGELLQIEVPAEFEGFGGVEETDEAPPRFGEIHLADGSEPSWLRDEEADLAVDQASRDFAAVNCREELGDVFIRHLGEGFDTGGLFVVYGNDAIGWRGISRTTRLPAFEKSNILLDKESILKDVVSTQHLFIGKLPETPANRQILYLLKMQATAPMLVLPVIMQGQTVAVVIVSVNGNDFRQRVVALKKLVRKMSLVIERLILKHKILMT